MKIKVNKKKTALILFLILVVFICGNAFAALVGAPNIFFAIRDLVSTEEKSGAEEILSDRDITISYSPIKIKDGIELQVNRILIEESKSTLFITLENKNKDKDKETIGINVYDMLENNNTNDVLSEDKFLVSAESKENFEIELNKKVAEDEKLKLEIIIEDQKVARNIILDLASKEIVVEGKEEVSKVSEKELKEYLDILTVLNATNNFTENDRLIYMAMELGNYLEIDIPEKGNREVINKLVESMYDANFDEKVLELEDVYFEYDKKLDSYKCVVNMGGAINQVMCLSVEDISFKDGIYTVEYVYAVPVDDPDISVEDYAQYKTTIELKLNEDSEYSKYKVVKLNKAEKISEEVSVDNVNADKKDNTDKEFTKEDNISQEIKEPEVNEEMRENTNSSFKFDDSFKTIEELAVLSSDFKDDVFKTDLNNDGVTDTIKVTTKINKGTSSIDRFSIQVNDLIIYDVEKQEIPFNSVKKIYVVDLNKNDNCLDIVIDANVPSDSNSFFVLKNNGDNSRFDVKEMYGIKMYLDQEDKLVVQDSVYAHTEICFNVSYYSLSQNKYKVVSANALMDKYVEFKNVYFTENLDNISKVLDDWELGFEKALEKNNVKDYNSVKAYVIDCETDKVKVQLEDGTIGYLFLGEGNFAG